MSIPDVMDDDEIVYKLLGENYGKKDPETIGRIMDAFADADALPASP
jgi:hypothetical protein